MKTLLCLLVIATAATQSLFAQITTLVLPTNGTQDIPVLAGEVFELLTWRALPLGSAVLKVDGVAISVEGNTNVYKNDAPKGIVVAGPRTVSVEVANQGKLVCTFKTSTVATVATQNVASQAVVIPENATSNADIIYESSTDLINWTAAVAGSYPPSTSKRFFRVRLVTH
jgi:hypothetical protein